VPPAPSDTLLPHNRNLLSLGCRLLQYSTVVAYSSSLQSINSLRQQPTVQ